MYPLTFFFRYEPARSLRPPLLIEAQPSMCHNLPAVLGGQWPLLLKVADIRAGLFSCLALHEKTSRWLHSELSTFWES